MMIVIDANEVFSTIISRGVTLDLLFNPELEIVSPDYLIDELNEHLNEIILRSRLTKEEIYSFTVLISYKIRFFKTQEYKEFLNRAIKITYDPDDADYLALALKLNCPIWSEDSDFKKQYKIKVYTTKELLGTLKS